MAKQKEQVEFEIIEHLGTVGKRTEKGWVKELNLVKWGEGEPKYDLRSWSEDHKYMGKGITLTKEEFEELKKLLK